MTDGETRILTAAILEYEENGINFTMDSLSKRAGISKKTLYEIIISKEQIIELIINKGRDSIKEKQKDILENDSMDVVEKLRGILTVVPEFHTVFSYNKLLQIKNSYPKLYEKIVNLLKDDWEPTFDLLNKGIMENKIKPINLNLFKEMYVAAIASIDNNKLIIEEDINYNKLLTDIISILIDGIIKK